MLIISILLLEQPFLMANSFHFYFIDEFLKDQTSIKYYYNKYNNSFINNHYQHVIIGHFNIANNERFCQLISKGSSY